MSFFLFSWVWCLLGSSVGGLFCWLWLRWVVCCLCGWGGFWWCWWLGGIWVCCGFVWVVVGFGWLCWFDLSVGWVYVGIVWFEWLRIGCCGGRVDWVVEIWLCFGCLVFCGRFEGRFYRYWWSVGLLFMMGWMFWLGCVWLGGELLCWYVWLSVLGWRSFMFCCGLWSFWWFWW